MVKQWRRYFTRILFYRSKYSPVLYNGILDLKIHVIISLIFIILLCNFIFRHVSSTTFLI